MSEQRPKDQGFGIPFLADMVRERVSTGSSLEDAIRWVSSECELRSEAIVKLKESLTSNPLLDRLFVLAEMSGGQPDIKDAIREIERLRAAMPINYLSVIAEREHLRAALEGAVEVIKTWHNMGGCEDVWDIYWRNAPEMKPIREALRPADETTAPQSIGGGPFGCEHNWNGSGPCPICHR